MDVARLGFAVDSKPLADANRELGKMPPAASAAERAANRLRDANGRFIKSAGATAAANDNIVSSVGRLGGAYTRLATIVAGLVTAAFAGMSLRKFIDGTVTAEAVQAQLAAALRSTAGAAGQTLASLNAHAAALQKITNFGDETINVAQAMLLTFTKIRGDVFPQATEAVLNVATAMGMDLKSAAIQVGKALNDPIVGMTALSRSGITFSEGQKAVVKQMVETGNIVGAQTLILKELESQFGGSAHAARVTLGGALKSLGNAFGDLFELSGGASDHLRQAIERLITAIQNPSFVSFVQLIGTAMFNAMTVLARGVSLVIEYMGDLYDLFRIFVAAKTVTYLLAATQSFLQMGRAIRATGLAMALFTRISRISVTGIAVIAGIVAKATGVWDDFERALGSVYERAKSFLPEGFAEGIDGAVSKLKELALGSEDVADGFSKYINAANSAKDSFGDISATGSKALEKMGKAAMSDLADLADWTNQRVEDAKQRISDAANYVADRFGDFFNGIEQGKSVWESFRDVGLSVIKDLGQALMRSAILKLFMGALGGGQSALYSGISMGFADGGYTGAGSKHQPAGIVHAGEYVFSASSVNRIGLRNLDRLHKGYAEGGYVGGSMSGAAANGNRPLVQIIDQRSGGSIEQEEFTGPNGEAGVRMIIKDEISKYASGSYGRHVQNHLKARQARAIR